MEQRDTTYKTVNSWQRPALVEEAREDGPALRRRLEGLQRRGDVAERRLPRTVKGAKNAIECEELKAELLREYGLVVTADGDHWIVTLA